MKIRSERVYRSQKCRGLGHQESKNKIEKIPKIPSHTFFKKLKIPLAIEVKFPQIDGLSPTDSSCSTFLLTSSLLIGKIEINRKSFEAQN